MLSSDATLMTLMTSPNLFDPAMGSTLDPTMFKKDDISYTEAIVAASVLVIQSALRPIVSNDLVDATDSTDGVADRQGVVA